MTELIGNDLSNTQKRIPKILKGISIFRPSIVKSQKFWSLLNLTWILPATLNRGLCRFQFLYEIYRGKFFSCFFFPKNSLSESVSFCEYLKFKKVFLLTNFFWDLPKVENSRNNIEVWKFICAEVDLGMMTLLSYQRSLLHRRHAKGAMKISLWSRKAITIV